MKNRGVGYLWKKSLKRKYDSGDVVSYADHPNAYYEQHTGSFLFS